MTVAVRGRVPRKWNDQTVRHITERLQALERDAAGAGDVFVGTGHPPFGPGAPGAPGAPGTPGAPGASDHGDLTGLDDKEDHRQYVLHEELAKPQPHIHSPYEVMGLEGRFPQRGEPVHPTPHTHGITDVVGLKENHPFRGEDARATPHQHTLTDIADHNTWENVLWQRVLEGLYGG